MTKNRTVAIGLAIASTVTPFAGFHKLYLGQPGWGLVYLLLSWTPLPHVASALEGLWYGLQSPDTFADRFGHSPTVWADLARTIGLAPSGSPSPSAATLISPIDVNRATVTDWQQLPGLKPHQAELLGQLGRSGVQFHCLEDLAAALDQDLAQLQPWEPYLCFAYYEPDPFAPIPKLNPNRASLHQLLQLPQMSPALAQSIVHHRIMQGPFGDLATFQQRLQLSPDQVQHFMHYLTFRPTPPGS